MVLVKADGVRACACVKAEADGLKAGDLCVADVAGRRRFCVARAVFPCGESAPPPSKDCAFVRVATADDAARRETNLRLAKTALKAFDTESAGAPQRPYAISAWFDEPRRHLLVLYHADHPFDARRIEMSLRRRFGAEVAVRQIGIRDEVAAVGSVGPCGCPVCCARALVPAGAANVNVKMAKRQNISLNPANLNGQCDRLKCCLVFENYGDAQEEGENNG
jgi:cell fate regulator YaaT (PSP1 superfamily)